MNISKKYFLLKLIGKLATPKNAPAFSAFTPSMAITNVFSINSQKYECPVDLRNKTIQVRYDRKKNNRFIVYFNDKRIIHMDVK